MGSCCMVGGKWEYDHVVWKEGNGNGDMFMAGRKWELGSCCMTGGKWK